MDDITDWGQLIALVNEHRKLLPESIIGIRGKIPALYLVAESRFLFALEHFALQQKAAEENQTPDWIGSFGRFAALKFEKPCNARIIFYSLYYMFVSLGKHYEREHMLKFFGEGSSLETLFQEALVARRTIRSRSLQLEWLELLWHDWATFLWKGCHIGEANVAYVCLGRQRIDWYKFVKGTMPLNRALLRTAAQKVREIREDWPRLFPSIPSLDEDEPWDECPVTDGIYAEVCVDSEITE